MKVKLPVGTKQYPADQWLDDEGRFVRGLYGPQGKLGKDGQRYLSDIIHTSRGVGYVKWLLSGVDGPENGVCDEDMEVLQAWYDRVV